MTALSLPRTHRSMRTIIEQKRFCMVVIVLAEKGPIKSIDHAIALYSEWVQGLFDIAFLSKGNGVIKHKFQIQSP